jgi:hypothetical protein
MNRARCRDPIVTVRGRPISPATILAAALG